MDILDNYSLNLEPKHKKQQLLQHLTGSDSLFIAKLSKATNKRLLIIANDSYNVNRIFDELSFFVKNTQIGVFPDTEVLPYERTTPQADLIASRLSILWQILLKQLDIVIVSANTIQTRLSPTNYLTARVLILKIGDKLSIDNLRKQLVANDYALVDRVYESGEFAIRGGVLDIIPMGSRELIRIELFDDEIESLKIIDVATNKSINSLDKIEIIPAREYPIDKNAIDTLISNCLFKFKEPNHSQFIKELRTYMLPAGAEFYLPLFFEHDLATIFDYLDDTWGVVYYENTLNHLNLNWQEINRRYTLYNYQYPCLKPSEIFIPASQVFEKINQFNAFEIGESGELATGIASIPNLIVDNKATNPFYRLVDFLRKFTGKVYLVVDSVGRLEVLGNTLQKFAITKQNYPGLELTQGFIYNGFICGNMAIITEYELYRKEERFSTHYIKKRRHLQNNALFSTDAIIADLAEIKVGDYVVHINHGIGRYLGLSTQLIGDISYDMLELEYQNEAKLFIPIQNLHLISRYTTINENNIQATKLGISSWDKTKHKIEKRIHDISTELLELYAKREMEQGFKFTLPDGYSDFANQFGYEPTVDQENSFKEIIEDMTNKKPMDRLICGDVGFGKTEVAMRSAFICAMNGKQVAILTPTTLLTEQHYEKFIDRFSGFPIRIAEISRFKTKKEILETLELTKNGLIDILIGTHRLIQDDVVFKDLGLIIIDEEHRFGVKQKERLKNLRVNVDTLAMTATPIPRTLSMALEGIRDFSIIATPPQKRLAVNTIICNEDKELIREAMVREIRRGGQVFFLYNDVETIASMYNKLLDLMPDLNIAIAHGQMKESQLEQTIRDFVQKRYNILLCSTIIETGIDIPNANTMFIYRADKLGLAQLHQLRGRVGRSHHQAYCYLIVPENISRDAEKRLEAIRSTSELGAGFNLALHDLEIRGAGEILGDKQSGDIKAVGMSLYTEMLKKAIRKLKNIASNSNEYDFNELSCEVDLGATSILPDCYCNSIHERLVYYKRLAKATSIDEVDLIYQDIINTHGIAPQEVKNLINVHYLRVKALLLGIKSLTVSNKAISLVFIDNPNFEPSRIVALMQTLKTCKLTNNKLVWQLELKTIEDKIHRAHFLLDSF